MLHAIDPKALSDNVFSLLDDKWALITAGTADRCNTMTASWGGLGVLWNKPTATIYVRPQRHTFAFLENSPTFTLSFFREGRRKELGICGTVSGRDADKFALCGFSVAKGVENAPYIGEADLVLVCRKRYWNDLDPAHMDEDALACYEAGDYHRMYIGEILQVLTR